MRKRRFYDEIRNISVYVIWFFLTSKKIKFYIKFDFFYVYVIWFKIDLGLYTKKPGFKAGFLSLNFELKWNLIQSGI